MTDKPVTLLFVGTPTGRSVWLLQEFQDQHESSGVVVDFQLDAATAPRAEFDFVAVDETARYARRAFRDLCEAMAKPLPEIKTVLGRKPLPWYRHNQRW